jgi:hypothetical protein
MTIDPATGGPHPPTHGEAGRFAWCVYRAGETVRCPGVREDRRASLSRQAEGDRRVELRTSPCPGNWGRAGHDTEVHIRMKPLHCGVEGPVGQLATCATCRKAIQIKHVPAVGRAA